MKHFIRYARLLSGIILLSIIFIQLFFLNDSLINYFSYFTILSNLLVSIIFILSFFKPVSDFLRGFVVLCMMLTGLGFIFLLGGNNDTFLPWTSSLFHYITPVIVVIDWLITPTKKIVFKQILFWLLFLLIYLVYSLIRGFLIQWYPYDFLDPKSVGNTGVMVYIGILLAASIILSWIIAQTGGKFYFFLKKTNL